MRTDAVARAIATAPKLDAEKKSRLAALLRPKRGDG